MIGDIIFVHGKGPISDAIEHLDKGPFSHVCIKMPHNCILESQYFVNTRIITNPYEHTKVIRLNLTPYQQEKLVDTAFKYLEDKYDLMQIVGLFFQDLFRLNAVWNSPKKLICSELVVDVLTDIGYFSLAEHQRLRNITPNGLYKILNQKGAI